MESDAAVDKIINQSMNAKTMTMRYYAIQAVMPDTRNKHGLWQLRYKKAIPKLIDLIYKDYPDEYRTWTRKLRNIRTI